jgi:hypothetical protein
VSAFNLNFSLFLLEINTLVPVFLPIFNFPGANQVAVLFSCA